MVPYI
jgi:hypothetical protein